MGDKIKELREKGYTYKQICDELGCAKSTVSYHVGSSRVNTGSPVKLDNCMNCGISLKGKSGRSFCSISCQQNFYREEYISRWKRGEEDGVTSNQSVSRFIRNYLLKLNNNSCQLCNWSVTNEVSGNVPLQLHHIDGNCLNNKECNLQILCPNCHSLTPNYGRLNSGSNRIR